MPAPLGHPVYAEFSGTGRESFEGKKRRGREGGRGCGSGEILGEIIKLKGTAAMLLGHARMGTYFLSLEPYIFGSSPFKIA
jgi:hypothetical protein